MDAEAWRRYYVVRGDSSIIVFVHGQKPLVETGFKIIGAHTDSPGLRIKPNAAGLVEAWLGWASKSTAGRYWRLLPTVI